MNCLTQFTEIVDVQFTGNKWVLNGDPPYYHKIQYLRLILIVRMIFHFTDHSYGYMFKRIPYRLQVSFCTIRSHYLLVIVLYYTTNLIYVKYSVFALSALSCQAIQGYITGRPWIKQNISVVSLIFIPATSN